MKNTTTAVKANKTVMVLLILGLSTIIFPLYMTIIIAFKQPSEMTNSISGILSLPKTWSLDNFREAMEVTDFFEKQFADFRIDCCIIDYYSLFNGIYFRKK